MAHDLRDILVCPADRTPLTGERELICERGHRYQMMGEAPSLVPFMTARDAPRVAFAALIERGLVKPGAKLVDGKKRHRALVRPDGALSLGDNVGSIHRIGALAQGLDACNGWTFWHIETPKGLMLIDELRAKVRAELD